MKICFISISHEESLDPLLDPPLGILYIAAEVKRVGYECSVVDLSFNERSEWKNVIPKADIYGITVLTASYHRALIIRDICKNINSNCKIVVGGSHPTALPEETAKDFDIVVVGDGEIAFEEAIKYVEDAYVDSGVNIFPKIIYGKTKDIDKIAFPARELVSIKDYTRTVYKIPATSIIASRGCPYRCSFCMNSTRRDKVRFRSVESIIHEIKQIIFEYDYKALVFYDDTFTIHPKLDELLDSIKELNIIFRCNGNARRDNKELFEKLYDSGCREIAFGIESGSQYILNNVNKKVTVEQNKLAILNAKNAGLMVKAFLMIGNPGESLDTINETIKFMQETRPQNWTLFTFVPLPGCIMYENPGSYGIKIVTNDYRQYFNIAGNNVGGLVSETEYMTVEDIAKARQYMLDKLPPQVGPLQKYYLR